MPSDLNTMVRSWWMIDDVTPELVREFEKAFIEGIQKSGTMKTPKRRRGATITIVSNKSGQARNPSVELKTWGERRRKVEALEEQRRLKRELADDLW